MGRRRSLSFMRNTSDLSPLPLLCLSFKLLRAMRRLSAPVLCLRSVAILETLFTMSAASFCLLFPSQLTLDQFYIGRELNPFSWGSFDLKTFNELRPGMILWLLLDISMICEQATRRGGFSQVTDSLWLILLFQGLYVSDSLYNEVRNTTRPSCSRSRRFL